MYTVVETPTFVADASGLWSDEERGAFCAWIAANPDAGDVIPGSGGCRKARWTKAGIGNAWRSPGDLFHPARQWRDLAAGHLRQECSGQHSSLDTQGDP